jgi:hypothetical protein
MGILKTFGAAALALVVIAPAAFADSCWWHNGSLMRLKDQGNQRWMYYETPKQSLWNAGVQRGTLLWNGTNNNDYYSGNARVFSSSCVGSPLEYWVQGPVLRSNNTLSIRMEGQREKHQNCYGTGQWTNDVLVFTYAYPC